MDKLKRLETLSAVNAAFQQFKLEQMMHQEFLEDQTRQLGEKFTRLERLAQKAKDPWGEEELDRLRQELVANAKQASADSHKRLTALLATAPDGVPARADQKIP